jgi:D-beta-D-heptose 7-phosphate kinase/D-beta-D-heptose 1-phosphate adenosyltransferase
MTLRVFVNGAFDVLHIGHVRMLEYASAFGHVTVGLNTDASVQKLKGPQRPVNSFSERMGMLRALRSVTHVVAFNDDTPVDLLVSMFKEGFGPHIVVKGSDYEDVDFPEKDLLLANDVSIKYYPHTGHSSTRVLESL